MPQSWKAWRLAAILSCGAILFWSAAGRSQEPPAESQPPAAKPNPPPPTKGGSLPWEAPPRVSEPVLRPPGSPREVLERFEINASQLEGFFNGEPLTPSEEDVLVKILYRLPRMGLENLQRWRQTKVTWDQLAAAPAEHRVEVFQLRGRVKLVTEQKLLPEQADLYEMAHFYRVSLDIDGAPYRALLLARRVPAAWKLDVPLDEPAAADGLFLKLGDSLAENPQLVFAAGRIAWLPENPQSAPKLNAGQVALAKLGMDAGQWELVHQTNGRGLGDEDREAFYQLLAALGRPEAGQLQAAQGKALDLVPLLEHATDHQGEVLPVEGLARRIMKVPVSDPDVQARFGIDHYYTIDLFVPLDKNLRFAKSDKKKVDKNQPQAIYENDFPATLVVRQLPPGVTEGENLHQQLRADGVFFKVWTYKSPYAARFKQLQPAPLFLATQPQIVEVETPVNWVVSTLVFGAFFLALSVVGIITWWQRTSDRRPARKDAPPSPADFSHLK